MSANNLITAAFDDQIKQFLGQLQVTRALRVKVPGKFFNGLPPTVAKNDYWVRAVEYRVRAVPVRCSRAGSQVHRLPRRTNQLTSY